MKQIEKRGAGSSYFVANIMTSHDQIAVQSVSFALQHLVKSPQNTLMTGTISREQEMHRELGQPYSRSCVSVWALPQGCSLPWRSRQLKWPSTCHETWPLLGREDHNSIFQLFFSPTYSHTFSFIHRSISRGLYQMEAPIQLWVYSA